MHNVIVADTSCLSLFYKIGELNILQKLFGKIHITHIVAQEYNKPLPEWITPTDFDNNLNLALTSMLDPGEASSIHWQYNMKMHF